MTRRLLSTTLVAGVAMAGAAVAQDSTDDLCTDGFLQADTNADAAISAQEASEARSVEFSTIDINDDGMISQ